MSVSVKGIDSEEESSLYTVESCPSDDGGKKKAGDERRFLTKGDFG